MFTNFNLPSMSSPIPFVSVFVPAAFGDMEEERLVRRFAEQRGFQIDRSWTMVPLVERSAMLSMAGEFIKQAKNEGTCIEVVDSATWLVRKTCTHVGCAERGHTMSGHLRFFAGYWRKAN
jgi:hypothetical protein